MQHIRAVCFDLFNTLVSVGRVPESIGRFTADILGLDRKRWRDACFGPHHVIWQFSDPFETLLQLARSIKPDISTNIVQQAVIERQARFDYALINVDQKILETLSAIRQKGIRLGLISNASSSEVQAWKDSPLSDLFDVVTFSCDCGHVKPELPIYIRTLMELQVEAEHCLFVGDGGSDEHLGAHAVGMKPVLITHYLHQYEYPQRIQKYNKVVEAVIEDLVELENNWFS